MVSFWTYSWILPTSLGQSLIALAMYLRFVLDVLGSFIQVVELPAHDKVELEGLEVVVWDVSSLGHGQNI